MQGLPSASSAARTLSLSQWNKQPDTESPTSHSTRDITKEGLHVGPHLKVTNALGTTLSAVASRSSRMRRRSSCMRSRYHCRAGRKRCLSNEQNPAGSVHAG